MNDVIFAVMKVDVLMFDGLSRGLVFCISQVQFLIIDVNNKIRMHVYGVIVVRKRIVMLIRVDACGYKNDKNSGGDGDAFHKVTI